MKKVFAAAFALAVETALLVFGVVSCRNERSKNLLDQIMAKGELAIATEGVWAPWSFHNDKNELTGFDVDVSKEICRRLGLRPKFVEMEWERIFTSLEKKECDVAINGVEATAERTKRFFFTQPYAYDTTAIITRKDNNSIKTFVDLEGRTSANSLGSTYYEIAESFGAISILVDSFDETIRLLLEDRADSTLNSAATIYHYLRSTPNAQVKVAAVADVDMPIAAVCRRGEENLSLLAKLNQTLEAMHSDGTLTEISMKYFEKDITK